MKTRYNKFLSFAAGLLVASGMTSCIGDLDTVPLNPNDKVEQNAYGTDEAGYLQGLARLYFQFITNDTKDLQVSDGGSAELIRAYWSVQETSTDEAKCAWSDDAWVRALNTNTWTEAQNDATYAVYVRTLQGIVYINDFLRQTTDKKLEERGVGPEVAAKVAGFRAEARFLRAYLYWIAVDTFGNVPFITEDSPFGINVLPEQGTRAEIFNFCIDELEDLVADGSAMPEARTNYPRADKGSVYGLLARMYLNAEVYTSVPMWEEAKAACEKIFTMGYQLCPDYASLFRGDNGENLAARNEFLFAIAYDAENSQSFGGTTYLTFAAIAQDDIREMETDTPDGKQTVTYYPNGVNGGWGGIRVPYEFVLKYFQVEDTDYSSGEYTCTDKRGQMFCIAGREESMEDALYVFLNGWSCLKFNNVPHDKTPEEYGDVAVTKAYSDIDFPLIRLGEIYLIYAEACLELNEPETALQYLQDLSQRAGVEAPEGYNRNYLIEERARELMWEGHRRTDLIRWGVFHTSDFLWPYKGGDSFRGQGFDQYKTLFALPLTDITANGTLVQNPGYKQTEN